jgi:Tol biopolymer transport system component
LAFLSLVTAACDSSEKASPPTLDTVGTATATPAAVPAAASPTPAAAVPPSPLSGKIVFRSDRDGQLDLYAMSSDGTGLLRLTADAREEIAVACDPTQGRLALVVGKSATASPSATPTIASLEVMNADGSNRQRVAQVEQVLGLSWSPDGSRLAYSSSTASPTATVQPTAAYDLFVVTPGSGPPTHLTSGMNVHSLRWSPDGSRLYFLSKEEDASFHLYSIAPDGSGRQEVPVEAGPFGPALSPDTQRIAYFTEEGLTIANVDGSNSTVVAPVGNFVIWSSSGRRLAYLANSDGSGEEDEPSSTLYVVEPGSEPQSIGEPPSMSAAPLWSPDDAWLWFNVYSEDEGVIYLLGADGQGLRRVSPEGVHDWAYCWLP